MTNAAESRTLISNCCDRMHCNANCTIGTRCAVIDGDVEYDKSYKTSSTVEIRSSSLKFLAATSRRVGMSPAKVSTSGSSAKNDKSCPTALTAAFWTLGSSLATKALANKPAMGWNCDFKCIPIVSVISCNNQNANSRASGDGSAPAAAMNWNSSGQDVPPALHSSLANDAATPTTPFRTDRSGSCDSTVKISAFIAALVGASNLA
mmetsp:Transcript_31368/g.75905  ORF Transcript_31368/g.75905 Transcript_31368/m.75905 type:complete len:206 (-) Transcript_31368:311-928(-)